MEQPLPPDGVHDYRDRYAGLPVVEFSGLGDDAELPDPGAVVWRFSTESYGEEQGAWAAIFTRFLERVDTTAVRAVVVGCWENPYEESAETVIRLLADNAARFPELRALFLGAIVSEECEISWIVQADVTPLLEAFPLLERLEVRGGAQLRLRAVRHEGLRMLRFESGGLPAEVVRAVGQCDLPNLEHLDLWLGVEEYGGQATVDDLEPILTGERLPRVTHLGLQDSEIEDEIATAVGSAPVVARLQTLSLSMGVLTDRGAEALLTGQPLTHLRRLDLHHHFLTETMMKRMEEALPGVDVDLGEQESPEDDWRFVAVDE
ncbi:hypothetical protein Pth03_55590 [Planotetraspora thailandica]|uniref:Cytoplasmic protein n=1 Tax=Planotetraspora thailandica TaxID=487172 RepID=A0A8J3XYC1_9ACTN|nr:STM4015 family protein [Planotetraspora thailandica]GII57170.1 hypothetical protein Pth03_55590 [Planotetraspora thailandica]